MLYYRMRVWFCILALAVCSAACTIKSAPPQPALSPPGLDSARKRADAQERAAAQGQEAAQRHEAARIAAALDDRLLAAQVIISGIDGRGRLGKEMRTLLAECPAGGIMLFRYNLDTAPEQIESLIAESAAIIRTAIVRTANAAGSGETTGTGIPPFVAVDHEGGDVNRFNPGVAALPAAGTYWELAQSGGREAALAHIEADSFKAASAIRRLGVTVNLAPVAETLSGANSAFLGSRSYGTDPLFTGEAASAFIRGMERAGVLCAVKHFPGSAGADPHRFPSVLGGDKAALDALAAPFAALIRGGQGRALMVSHSAVPALDSTIASLSPAVMRLWLRDELGFTGIIISDDFSMAAAGDSGVEAAPRSLAAGADMVLVWPPDLRRTHREIIAALANGTLSRDRLRESAERIIFEKIRMDLLSGNEAHGAAQGGAQGGAKGGADE
jgi:beta-N-acetylhexosaminidase